MSPRLRSLLVQIVIFYFTFSAYIYGFALFAERRFTYAGKPLNPQQIGYAFAYFGHTGLTVSRMILGAGTFGKQTDEKEAHRMLDKAGEAGINFIDIADVYPPGAEGGGAEIIVGRWLSNKRSGFILGTKGGGKMGPAAWDAGSSRKHLLDNIDASLCRLNTDYVDLYQLHMDDPATPIDEMAEAMDTIVRFGQSALYRRIEHPRLPSGESAWTAGHTKADAFRFGPTTLQLAVP